MKNSFINSVSNDGNIFFNFSYVDNRIKAYNQNITELKHALKIIKRYALKVCSFDNSEQNINNFQNIINQTIYKKYEIIDNKKTLLNHYYNSIIEYKPIPKNNLYFTNNDNNFYLCIDDRFNLSKWNIKIFLKKLLLKKQIGNNEYKKYIRYGKQSDNIKRHIYFYLSHNLLKVKSLKNKYLLNIKPRKKEHIILNNQIINLKPFAIIDNKPNFKLIVSELKQKTESEQNIYVFSKINNQ